MHLEGFLNRSPFALAVAFFFSAAFSQAPVDEMSNPVADPGAIVISGDARFTILTPRLIRMEWSAQGKFEDRASLLFINRRLPVPKFEAKAEGDWLVITTGELVVKYRKNSGRFSADNLEIKFKLNSDTITWRPGMKNRGNLLGTIRTLDGVKGATDLEPGLLSRDGWVLIDDSDRPLFDDSDWHWVVERPRGERSVPSNAPQDWYFFGYGHEYKKELGDFVKVAGRIPMPPRYAFGAWWSRYWAYTDAELKELVRQFHTFNVPLDVLVVDMDWHETFGLRWKRGVLDQAGQMKGWTGYTWNKILFPDPPEFLKWCKEKNLKITLNLHPASGVQPFEERYPAMAKAMGVDPSTQNYIPFNITEKKFALSYFDVMLRPLEKEGVDFWWIDWQQWDTTAIHGLNPTWWLNYAFYSNMEREGRERPIILARWGGLGNHRYQVGFSGDVISDWSSLAFQPYFTATAANVGFGYWSHDIGGHIPGPVAPELYTRWVQWGALSPILRTHTTRNAEAERRIWAYPFDYFNAMHEAFLLRYSLIPYIYTASRRAYETGVSMIHPLYYDYPELSEAYDFKGEYMFGDDIMVAPVVRPISQDTLLASQSIWVPPGKWIEWCSGEHLRGPKTVERHFALDEIPIYVKEGSIIPMAPQMMNTSERPVDPLILTIFPADSGSTRIYEDEGNSLGYMKGEYSWTTVKYRKLDDLTLKVEIEPVEGQYAGMPQKRAYEIKVIGVLPPESVVCVPTDSGPLYRIMQGETSSGWHYDGDRATTIISLPEFSVHQKVETIIKFHSPLNSPLLDGIPGKLRRLKKAMEILNHLWIDDWSPDSLIIAAQTGNRMTLFPENAEKELQRFHAIVPKLKSEIGRLEGDRDIIRRALNHLCDTLPR